MRRSSTGPISMLAGVLMLLCMGTGAISAVTVPIPIQEQEQSNWCWNASSQMILNHFGYNLTQNVIAKYAVEGGNWGNVIIGQGTIVETGGTNYGCNLIMEHWGIPVSRVVDRVLTPAEWRSEVDAGRPFIISWFRKAPGPGHMVVGYGYDEVNTNYVYYMDPGPIGTGSSNYALYSWVVDNSTSYWTWSLTVAGGPVTTDPLVQTEAENYDVTVNAGGGDLPVQDCSEGGKNLVTMDRNDYIGFNAMKFGPSGVQGFAARIAGTASGNEIQIILDSITGRKIGTLQVPVTGGWQTWKTAYCNFSPVVGIHKVYLKFYNASSSSAVFNFNWFKFTATNPGQTEAEAMTLSNYTTEANTAASGGSLVTCPSGEGTASFTWLGNSGPVQIKTTYFDENDGNARFTLSVAGSVRDEWVANQNLGSANPVAATKTSRTISRVMVNYGDLISVKGLVNGSENARIDLIEVISGGNLGYELVRDYRFNGNCADATQLGPTMTPQSGASYSETYITDRFGSSQGAILFDGIDDFAWTYQAGLPEAERTVSLWFKANNVTTHPTLISYGRGFSNETSFNMSLNRGDFPGCFSVHGNHPNFPLNYSYSSQTPINAWYHMVATTNHSGTKVYVNGQLVASNPSLIDNTIATTNCLAVGVATDRNGNAPFTDGNYGYLNGSVDDLKIYNRAVSPDEVGLLYNAPPTVATPAVSSAVPVYGTTTNLSVLGSDDYPESNLTYTWSVLGTTAAPVTFSVNGTNAAKNTIATFSQAGTYNFQVTIKDQNNAIVNSYVNNLQVTQVGTLSGWVLGTNNPKVAGTNRLMTVMVMGESNANFNATAVTYGGQAMTKQADTMYYTTGNRTYASIFTLKETGVNAATSGTIAVTWSATPSVGSSIYSVLLANVDQTTPVSAIAKKAVTGSSIATPALSAGAGDMVVMCGATGGNITQTVNSGYTKQFESNSNWGDGVGGSKISLGGSETPGFSQNGTDRMALCAMVVKTVALAPVNYSLTVNSIGGAITLNPAGGSYAPGTVVTVTAAPDINYEFKQWSGDHSGTVNPATITMNGNKTITAEYTRFFELSVLGSVNCTVELSPAGGRYAQGTVVTLTAIPDPGFKFDHWSDDLSGTVNPATTTMNNDKGIRGHCVPIAPTNYTLTANAVNGQVFLNPPGGTYASGTVVTVTAEPFQGYQFSNWSGAATGTVNPVQITMDGNKSLTANHTEITTSYVTAITGWVSGTNNPKVAGNNRLMTVMVMGEGAADLNATGVTYGGQPMTKQSEKRFSTGGNRTYASIFTLNEAGVNAASSGTIAVTWSPAASVGSSVYSVLLSNVDQTTPVSAMATNGLTGTTITTTPFTPLAGDMVIMCGATGSNTTPSFNNLFNKQFESNTNWGDGVGGNKVGNAVSETPSFSQPSSDRMVLCAIVVKRAGGVPPVTYTLTPTATNGTITLNPPGGTYTAGTVVTVTATPNSGYAFANWSGDLTGSTNQTTITMNANKSVTANFTVIAPTNYTLTTNATNGTISPAGGSYASGTVVTLTAIPDSGYRFVNWSGDLSGSTTSATITMNANKSVTANFAQYTLNCTALPNNSGGISLSVGYRATVTAIPNAGYVFSHWSGDLTGSENPTTIVRNSDKSITANFTAVGVGAAVSMLGSWTVGPTHAKEPGTNRALVVMVYGEHSAAMSVSSVTYGGQAMTLVVEKSQGTTTNSYVGAYILKESGIVAATSNAIVVTWATTPSSGSSVSSVFLSNVNQAAPVGATAFSGADGVTSIVTSALSNSSGDMVLLGAVGGSNGTYTINNGFIRGPVEQAPTWGDITGAYKQATGAAEIPSVTMGSSMRQAIVGFVVNKAAPVVQYTITATYDIGYNTISPSGAVLVNQGSDQTFTIASTSGDGYQVTVDGNIEGQIDTYTFTNVTANHTIIVSVSGSGSPIQP